jgi:hypothetical protein
MLKYQKSSKIRDPSFFPTSTRNERKIPFARLNEVYSQFCKNFFLCAGLHKRPVAFLFLWKIIDVRVRVSLSVVIRGGRRGILGIVVPLPEAVFVE